MLSTRAWRVYRALLALALIAILIPAVGVSFYTRPSADDLAQPLPVALVWRETGSLLKTLGAAFEAAWEIYHEYSGIFFSMWLSVMPFSIFGVQWTWVNAVLTMALLLWAMNCVAKCMPLLCPGVCREAVHCASLLLSLMAVLLLPSWHEGIFWFSGAVNYTCVLAMGIGLFADVAHRLADKRISWGRTAFWCLGFLCMGGGNWMTSTASIVVWGFIALYVLFKKLPLRAILPMAFLAAGYLLAILAPGTANRQASMNVDAGLIASMVSAFRQSLTFVFSDARWYVFCLLMLPVFAEMLSHCRISFRWAAWVPAASLCVLAAAMFPLLYQSSYWNDRHTNTCFLLLVVLLPINLFWVLGWVMRRFNIRLPQKPLRSGRLLAGAVAVAVAIGALSVPGMTLKPLRFNCTLQPVTAMMQLVDGQLKTYADWYDGVVEEVRSRPGEEIVLRQMQANEFINPGYLVIDDAQDWMNTSFAQYFGRDCTIVYDPSR